MSKFLDRQITIDEKRFSPCLDHDDRAGRRPAQGSVEALPPRGACRPGAGTGGVVTGVAPVGLAACLPQGSGRLMSCCASKPSKAGKAAKQARKTEHKAVAEAAASATQATGSAQLAQLSGARDAETASCGLSQTYSEGDRKVTEAEPPELPKPATMPRQQQQAEQIAAPAGENEAETSEPAKAEVSVTEVVVEAPEPPPGTASPGRSVAMDVTVPEGHKAGDTITLDLGGGLELDVVIPEGHRAGDTFEVELEGGGGVDAEEEDAEEYAEEEEEKEKEKEKEEGEVVTESSTELHKSEPKPELESEEEFSDSEWDEARLGDVFGTSRDNHARREQARRADFSEGSNDSDVDSAFTSDEEEGEEGSRLS
eukprot:COSAG06_NODE_3356_length_5459_cov_9.584452_2_plen_369_part_00